MYGKHFLIQNNPLISIKLIVADRPRSRAQGRVTIQNTLEDILSLEITAFDVIMPKHVGAVWGPPPPP